LSTLSTLPIALPQCLARRARFVADRPRQVFDVGRRHVLAGGDDVQALLQALSSPGRGEWDRASFDVLAISRSEPALLALASAAHRRG
jgi:hypothetical protein